MPEPALVDFEALVAEHRALMVRVAYLITGSEAEAEDATQEALVKAYNALPRFHPGAPFRPWLMRIVANEAKNRRKAAARRWGLADRTPEPHPIPSPEGAALQAEERALVLEVLKDLRDEDRQVITHRYLLDMNEAETAEALGWPRGTVKSRLSRAMTRLRGSTALRAYLAVAALLALLTAAVVASPDLRTAIADRLGIRGIGITHVPSVPDRLPETPCPAPCGVEGRGDPKMIAFQPLTLPQNPTTIHYADDVPGGRATFVYDGFLLMQFRGDIMNGNVALKGLPPGTRMEVLTVNGGPGVWLEGAPHLFFVRDANGRTRDETVRLAGNVLLWEQNGLAVRLEGVSTKEEARRLAATVR